MPVPIRTLRTHLEDLPGFRPKPTTREIDRADRILAAAQSLLARYGRTGLTLGSLAAALRLSTASVRRLFPDLDSVLQDLLQRHLRAIARAIGEVPQDTPDRQAACRAAYLAYTRTAFYGFTEAHLLMVRDRHTLPPDLAAPIDQIRLAIGQMLGNADGLTVLALLDLPDLSPNRIEILIAALHTQEPPAAVTLRPTPPTISPPSPPTAHPRDIPWELISKAPPFPDLYQPRAGPPPRQSNQKPP